MAKRTMKKFGVVPREGYNSDGFYARALFEKNPSDKKISFAEQPIPSEVVDRIFCQDSRRMQQLPDNSVHLMVTSPPYNVGKEYDDNLSLGDYLQLLYSVFAETHRVLVPGGRACINVANLGRKPYIPLHASIIDVMSRIGYLMRGEIIWDKSASVGASTAWGSWRSASNPTLRDVHEYILIFSKDTFQRGRKGKSSITKEQFLEYTRSIWTFPAESAKRAKHPAPFPVELPHRLIQLYTFEGDAVLDPFCGSGTTCVAAQNAGRHFAGFDVSREYVATAMKRISSQP